MSTCWAICSDTRLRFGSCDPPDQPSVPVKSPNTAHHRLQNATRSHAWHCTDLPLTCAWQLGLPSWVATYRLSTLSCFVGHGIGGLGVHDLAAYLPGQVRNGHSEPAAARPRTRPVCREHEHRGPRLQTDQHMPVDRGSSLLPDSRRSSISSRSLAATAVGLPSSLDRQSSRSASRCCRVRWPACAQGRRSGSPG